MNYIIAVLLAVFTALSAATVVDDDQSKFDLMKIMPACMHEACLTDKMFKAIGCAGPTDAKCLCMGKLQQMVFDNCWKKPCQAEGMKAGIEFWTSTSMKLMDACRNHGTNSTFKSLFQDRSNGEVVMTTTLTMTMTTAAPITTSEMTSTMTKMMTTTSMGGDADPTTMAQDPQLDTSTSEARAAVVTPAAGFGVAAAGMGIGAAALAAAAGLV